MIHTLDRFATSLRRLLPAMILLVLSGASTMAQTGGILTVGMSQNVNWMPETDSLPSFRSTNGIDAGSLATLGSEITLGYEYFLDGAPNDSTSVLSVQLVAGFLQRGYRMAMVTNDSCLAAAVYRSGSSWGRVGAYARSHIPIGRRSFVVWQAGAAAGKLISAFDNAAEVQYCRPPDESLEAIYPAMFVELGAGLGIRQKISSRLIGGFSLLGYMPLLITESESRPDTRNNAQSVMVDVRTPNLALQINVGYMF